MKQTKPVFQKLMALLLVFVLVLGGIPGNAFALESGAAQTDVPTAATTETTAEESDAAEETTQPALEDSPKETEPTEESESTEPVQETEVPETSETVPAGEAAAAVTEPTAEPEVPASPVPLNTTVEYYEDYFAELAGEQEGISYRILISNANYSDPGISACTFPLEPDLNAVGFEISLDGISYSGSDPKAEPSGELEIRIQDQFVDSDLSAVHVFDISHDTWIDLTADEIYNEGGETVVRFWAPNVSSRFAVVEGNPDAQVYDWSYAQELGSWSQFKSNNKGVWVVAGPGSGYGNSSTGTFDIHLTHRPDTDPEARTVGYGDWIAGGCLESWKYTPICSYGQTVNAEYGGNTSGWSRLSVETRKQIVGYLLYGVRYISDGSFIPVWDHMGPATTSSWNGVVNMAYAQQLLIWAAIDGRDPYEVAGYYGNDVPYFMDLILGMANYNAEHYDYGKTLVIVGESDDGERQDCVFILKPEKEDPDAGSISVNKSVTGSSVLSGWRMELYTSYENAESATDPVSFAITDESGRAVFQDLKKGTTYYVREAPASRQDQDLTNWTLSTQILSATVAAGSTTDAGTICNTYEIPYGYSLHKRSVFQDQVQQQIEGNPMYSLAGARFQVSRDGEPQEILVTDASGNASGTMKYPVGTKLEIQEIEAPPGYCLDSTVYYLNITAGDNCLSVEDMPLFDPPFSITKVDQTTTLPQGSGSFSGAVFKWEFYPNTDWSGSPARTWYFKTDANGTADYDPKSLAPEYQSDPLYMDQEGAAMLPLGTVRMTEIQNSLGYTVLPQPLSCIIRAEASVSSGVTHEFTPESMKYIADIAAGNIQIREPIDQEHFGSFVLHKIDSQTGTTPQGNADLSAGFEITNDSANPVYIEGVGKADPGQVCYEFRTDASGHFASDRLFPVGTYTIREKTPPAGYLPNTDWSQSFSVTAENQSFDFSAESGKACTDQIDLFGSFSLHKLDIHTGRNPQGDATLEGAEFELLNNSLHPIQFADKLVEPGEVLMTFSTDADGYYAYTGLPLGSYWVQEKQPPEGYLWDHVWQYDFSITPESRDVVIDDKDSCKNYVLKGGLKIIKQDSLHGVDTGENDPLNGITFQIINESKHAVLVNEVLYQPGEVVMQLEIQWDGTQWSAETGTILPYGTYGVVEVEMYPGMANDSYGINPEKHLVELRESEAVLEITHVNAMAEGKIIVHKADPLGKPLAGAKFLVEWSEDDGTTWHPVVSTNIPNKGGCTSPGLADGTLTTGEDGVITFSGLHPTLKYRVTELEAPEGYVLLRDYAYSDFLPTQSYVYEMTVHNSRGFTFPTTGADGLMPSVILGSSLVAAAIFMAVLLSGKRKSGKRESNS